MKILNFFVVSAFVLITSTSFSQDAQKVADIFKECACREIIMITRGVEKTYTGVWLEGIEVEKDFIVFSRGDNKHRWNAEQITFIEKGNGFIRVYLN